MDKLAQLGAAFAAIGKTAEAGTSQSGTNTGNPGNPNSPPRRVTWGDGTLNEMLYCFFLITAEKTEDTIHTIFDNLDHDSKQPRAKVALTP